MEVPSWVYTAVGIYAILGSALFLVLIVVAAQLTRVLLELSQQVKILSSRVQTLTDKVQGIADQVSTVTTEVGARTTGIVRLVDEKAAPAINAIEFVAPFLFIVGAFLKLRGFAGRRRR